MKIHLGWTTLGKDFGPTARIQCEFCEELTWLSLMRERTWFQLFFIPIIPLEEEWQLVCENCESPIDLPDQLIEQARVLNDVATRFLRNEISEDTYDTERALFTQAYAKIRSPAQKCPSCGSKYRLTDYRTDVDHIFCAECKAELPRKTTNPTVFSL